MSGLFLSLDFFGKMESQTIAERSPDFCNFPPSPKNPSLLVYTSNKKYISKDEYCQRNNRIKLS